jgi:hypothetical protein
MTGLKGCFEALLTKPDYVGMGLGAARKARGTDSRALFKPVETVTLLASRKSDDWLGAVV